MRARARGDGGHDRGSWTEAGRVRSWTLFEDRASTSVLGFTLMFSITMTTFALYQADMVPHQNERIELQHNQALDDDMRKLAGAMQQATVEDAEISTTVDTAPEYPGRALARNPPQPDGRLLTGTLRSDAVRLSGFRAADGPRQYWDGSTRKYDTRFLRYEPDYNLIEGSGYWFENGVVGKRYANGRSRVLRGQVVSGDTIELRLLAGDLDRSGDSVTLRFRPVSSTTERLVVEPGADPTITLPTRLSMAHWERRQRASNRITDVRQPSPGTVTIELDDSASSYQLQVTKLTVDSEAEAPDPAAPVAYVTADTDSVDTPVGTAATVTLRTRDRFGNPTGATVDLSTSDSTLAGLLPSTVETGPDGHATVRITPSTTLDASFTAEVPNVDGGSYEAYRRLSVAVEATSSSPSTVLPQAIYTGGQMFDDLGGASSLRLSEGRTVPANDEDCTLVGDSGGLVGDIAGSVQCDTDSFRTLQGSLALTKGNSKQLQVRYYLFDENGDGTVNGDDDAAVRIRDDSGEKIFEGELKRGAAKRLLDDRGVDLFDGANYDTAAWSSDSGGVVGDPFDEEWGKSDPYGSFADLQAHKVETLFVERAEGRVTVDT